MSNLYYVNLEAVSGGDITRNRHHNRRDMLISRPVIVPLFFDIATCQRRASA